MRGRVCLTPTTSSAWHNPICQPSQPSVPYSTGPEGALTTQTGPRIRHKRHVADVGCIHGGAAIASNRTRVVKTASRVPCPAHLMAGNDQKNDFALSNHAQQHVVAEWLLALLAKTRSDPWHETFLYSHATPSEVFLASSGNRGQKEA